MLDIGTGRGPAGEWVDQRTGRKLTVLAKGESMARALAEQGEVNPGYDLADCVKYMAGLKLPADIRAALGETAPSSGQYLVNPALSAIVIDKIRAKSRVMEAGAQTVAMPDTPVLYMARLTTDPQVVWHAENTADLVANVPVFDRVTFTARTLGAVIVISRELLEDAPNVGDEITTALAKAMALEVDRAALLGDGTSNSPYGLAHITGGGITSTTGTAISDYSQFVSSIGRILSNSGMPTAIITSPQVRIKCEGLQDTLHQPLRKPDIMATVPILDTAKVPYGASPLTGSAAYVGDYTYLWLGVRAQLELNFLRERYVEYGQYALASWLRVDVQCAHPELFDIVTNLS